MLCTRVRLTLFHFTTIHNQAILVLATLCFSLTYKLLIIMIRYETILHFTLTHYCYCAAAISLAHLQLHTTTSNALVAHSLCTMYAIASMLPISRTCRRMSVD